MKLTVDQKSWEKAGYLLIISMFSLFGLAVYLKAPYFGVAIMIFFFLFAPALHKKLAGWFKKRHIKNE